MQQEKWIINQEDIGTTGSESGIIILDLEYAKGGRISLEKNTTVAPFAITIGIYGLLMHTIYCKDETIANNKVAVLKELIEKAINHYEFEQRQALYLTIDEIVDL